MPIKKFILQLQYLPDYNADEFDEYDLDNIPVQKIPLFCQDDFLTQALTIARRLWREFQSQRNTDGSTTHIYAMILADLPNFRLMTTAIEEALNDLLSNSSYNMVFELSTI